MGVRCVAWFLVAALATGCGTRPETRTTEDPERTLVVVGQALIEHDPRAYLETPLRSVAPILRASDGVFTNVEVAIAGPACTCEPTRTDVYFHGAGPEVLDYLKSLNVSLISLANNHAWDYGAEGVASSIAEAESRGFVYAGTGADVSTATAPAYLDLDGFSLSLVAAASVNVPEEARATDDRAGVNMLDPSRDADRVRNLASVRTATAASELTMVYQHFQTDADPGWQESWAHAAVDAGADIYVSHGEPTLAGVEIYRGSLILYGLGNFIFHTKTDLGRYTDDVWESVIAELTIDEEGVVSVIFTPIALDSGTPGPLFFETRGYPEVAEGEVAERILRRLSELSIPYGTKLEMADGKATLRVR